MDTTETELQPIHTKKELSSKQLQNYNIPLAAEAAWPTIVLDCFNINSTSF